MESGEVVGDLFDGWSSGLLDRSRTNVRLMDWTDVDFVSEHLAEVEALARVQRQSSFRWCQVGNRQQPLLTCGDMSARPPAFKADPVTLYSAVGRSMSEA